MYTCMKVDPTCEKNIMRLTEFLSKFDLKYEVLDSLYVVIDEKGDWIGTGGRFGNVLKGFGVLDEYRSEAIIDIVLSELIKESYNLKLTDLFIFTKSMYSSLFGSFGFKKLADTKTSCLLLRSDRGVQGILNSIAPNPMPKGINGAVVMNANPFTYGHRHLVKYASRQVDNLFVFVVENDASFFNTADRYSLVKQGSADIKNAIVLPSTNLIVSSATFPSYFLKEKQEISIEHAKIDALIFVKYFVPKFNISIRFLGEEPLDANTAIYNRCLTEILPPRCGVKIIERLKTGADIISATKVRERFKQGDISGLKKYVPPTTYNYLESRL